jgi:hypothetical protein
MPYFSLTHTHTHTYPCHTVTHYVLSGPCMVFLRQGIERVKKKSTIVYSGDCFALKKFFFKCLTYGVMGMLFTCLLAVIG